MYICYYCWAILCSFLFFFNHLASSQSLSADAATTGNFSLLDQEHCVLMSTLMTLSTLFGTSLEPPTPPHAHTPSVALHKIPVFQYLALSLGCRKLKYLLNK